MNCLIVKKTPLKGFLACLTFCEKKLRLIDLHKRTIPGSAPILSIRSIDPCQYFWFEETYIIELYQCEISAKL